MNWTEFNARMSKVFADFGGCWTVDEDNYGQIIVYTGLREKEGSDELVLFDLEEAEKADEE